MGHGSLSGSHGRERARASWVQQLELSSLSRSGSYQEWSVAARWIYHAHECTLGYKRTSEVDDGKEKKACHKFPHPRRDARRPAHLMSLRVTTKCQRRLGLSTNSNVIGGDSTVRRVVKGSRSFGVEASEEQFATHLDTVQHIRQTAGLKRGAEDDVVVSPAKRAHTIPFPFTQALLLSATGWKAMLVPGGAMHEM